MNNRITIHPPEKEVSVSLERRYAQANRDREATYVAQQLARLPEQ
jgi:hypothetical protein